MAYRDTFDLDYTQIPLVFESMFGTDDVFIGLNYNEDGGFFTVDLSDANYDPIILGEKLVYGKRLWRQSVDPRVPMIDLVPLDESGKETAITKDNFGTTVLLYVDTLINADGTEPDVDDDTDETEG